jgi:Plasmid pRiA4b ORF-3-like protein
MVARAKIEYVFRVNLKGAKRIWRLVGLTADRTLDDLHWAIFAAFDRDDEHLYSFYFPHAPRSRSGHARVREYVAPFAFEEPGPWDDGTRFDASATRLKNLELKVGHEFEYLFDYGDSWWHQVRVEAIQPVVAGTQNPTVRERHGVSPPQYAQDE